MSKFNKSLCLIAMVTSCSTPKGAGRHAPPPNMGVNGPNQGQNQDVEFKKPIKIGYKAPDNFYPEIARLQKIEGSVELIVKVSPDGLPLSFEVVKGPQLLRDAAIEYARTLHFDKSAKASTLQPRAMTIGIIFKLDRP